MAPLPVVTFILGAWNLGISGDLLLQGVLFAQFTHYITLYKKDILLLRAFVGGLLVLTTLKTVQCLAMLWAQNVVYFVDVFGALNMFYAFWPTEINVMFVAFIAFYVQLFFCQRLWAISKNIYIVGLIVALFVFALVAAFVATAFIFADNSLKVRPWLAINLSTVFAGDVILCASTIYFLLNRSNGAMPQTAGMLKSIMKLTFQSAAPAALCALINLVASQAGNKIATANAFSMVAIIANTLLPKLYAISAMWTLNSRRDLRLARSNGQNTSSTEGTSGRRARTNNVELGILSGAGNRVPIQVRTQVQTVQHSDGMFSKSALDYVDERDSATLKN
ncbi:hypothetical protein B0H17DRAFT_1216962 [Mycena rosella]|uniref:DUF6534 domain-containing protein n=1 Tax=Mycena rosella TaxID=1033263 RepID=A0AAD7C2X9_MYCRO|nr:hypothetical protein B0H17DRAFT_1216962 [Mycena rosella]